MIGGQLSDVGAGVRAATMKRWQPILVAFSLFNFKPNPYLRRPPQQILLRVTCSQAMANPGVAKGVAITVITEIKQCQISVCICMCKIGKRKEMCDKRDIFSLKFIFPNQVLKLLSG